MIPGVKKRAFNLHDVLMYVAVARKHLRLMALLICFSLTCGLTYYIYARPVYYSKSVIKVTNVALPLDTEKLYRDGRLGVVIRDMTSPPMVERTAKALGITGSDREIRHKHLAKMRVTINFDRDLEIEVWPTNMAWIDSWAPTMLREYLALRLERRMQNRQEIVTAYETEMGEVTRKLDETLDGRWDLRDEQDVTRMNIKLNTFRNVPAELVRIGKRLDDMGLVRIKLQDPTIDVISKLSLLTALEKEDPIAVGQEIRVPGELNDQGEKPASDENARRGSHGVVVVPSMMNETPKWEEYSREQQRLKREQSDSGRMFLPGHKKMVALQKSLSDVATQLEVELQIASNHFMLEYQNLLNRREDYQARLPEYTALSRQGAKVRQNSSLFESSQLAWGRMRSDMARKLEALDFAGDKERVDLVFGDVVDRSAQAISPHRSKLLLVSLAIGVLLALGIPFLVEYLDHTTSNLEHVESTFQLRGLGIVPKMDGLHSADALIDRGSGNNNLVENFRVIRTNLISMGGTARPPHVLMVTSAQPREGKTVVASNLAISFAQMGARTLLVDIDLRRGRMHRLFGYRKSPGLSNVLLGECTLDDALRTTTYDNLTILSAGKHLESGTELLGSASFAALLATLRERFDRVVVDTPPVLGLSETSVVQNLMDGVLFVIWSGHTPIRNMKAAIEMLQANGANFYGFVLNRLDLSATTNYYQYYYYSHDYYYHYAPKLEGTERMGV